MVDVKTQKRVFSCLKHNCYGEKNGWSAHTASVVCLSGGNKRELRRICAKINANPEIKGIISTSKSIYVCRTKSECRRAIETTYKMAFAYLRKARAMEKKVNLNGQYKFTDENGIKCEIIFKEGE